MTRCWRSCRSIAVVPLLLSGCSEIQSVLAPAGPQSASILLLFWILTAVCCVILAAVVALAVVAIVARAPRWNWLGSDRAIVWGGIVAPVVVLTGLLGYSLLSMPAGAAALGGSPADFRVTVIGERWWWRVIYTDAAGRRFESANEIHIPVQRRVQIELRSADVIHSFWVPRLAGKLDMIPGRTNRLVLTADEPGVSRGQCAEFCGGAHALMSFHVVAHDEPAHRAWLEREVVPARVPANDRDTAGRALFIAAGCGSCHAVRGTSATGRIGPDLTHLGSRRSLGAATLANDRAAIARWIRDNQHLKPDNRMPAFAIFSASQLEALSGYLASLRHDSPDATR